MKKAQTVITVFFWVLGFIILWALFLGNFLNTQIANAISVNGLTGIEAFLLSYLNLFVYLIIFVFIIIVVNIVKG